MFAKIYDSLLPCHAVRNTHTLATALFIPLLGAGVASRDGTLLAGGIYMEHQRTTLRHISGYGLPHDRCGNFHVTRAADCVYTFIGSRVLLEDMQRSTATHN